MTVAVEQLAEALRDRGLPPQLSDSPVQRMGWTVASLVLIFSGLQVWGASSRISGANLAAMLLILVALMAMWGCWASRRPPGVLIRTTLMVGLTVGLIFQAFTVYARDPAYGTDAVAFDHYAAAMLLHGHDPYAMSMRPSLELFHVPVIFSTYTLSGQAITHLSYPAGSFLLYVPLLALGLTTQAGNITDIIFWAAGLWLLCCLLPRSSRWVAAVMLGSSMYTSYVLGGVTDTLFLPFVVVALWRWDRYADPLERTAARWIGPLALGIAMTVKQTPWFLLPFLLIGTAYESRARGGPTLRVVARYGGVTLGTFLAVNAPFIVWAPKAWLRGVMVPLTDPTIPDGQGIVNALIFDHIGGGNLEALSIAGAAFVIGCLVAFTLRYEALKRGWVVMVALAFFWPTRSFGSYLIMMLPAAVAAAMTVSQVDVRLPYPRMPAISGRIQTGALLAVPAIVFATGLGVAFMTPAPLTISIVDSQSTGQMQTLDQLTVTVQNHTGDTLRPHFTVNSSEHVTTFWYPFIKGHRAVDVSVPPHGRTTITLRAPNVASMPSLSLPFTVEAFTQRPNTISVSNTHVLSRYSTTLSPSAFDEPVPSNTTVHLTAQLEDHYGAAVHRAGVQLTLGQTVYTQVGLTAGESSINGSPEGKSPVTALTDTEGRAQFDIRPIQPQSRPIYFQVWVDPGNGRPPYGYSNMVSIQFVKAGR